jgi:predicted nuclease of predicted toxin-antitoxin system
VNFLADESVDRQIVDRLRQDGHAVRHIAEMDPGMSDDIVLELAYQQTDLRLTADKDFGELVFRQGRLSCGILLVRLAGLPPVRKAELVASAVYQHQGELPGSFAVLSPRAFRIRRLE